MFILINIVGSYKLPYDWEIQIWPTGLLFCYLAKETRDNVKIMRTMKISSCFFSYIFQSMQTQFTMNQANGFIVLYVLTLVFQEKHAYRKNTYRLRMYETQTLLLLLLLLPFAVEILPMWHKMVKTLLIIFIRHRLCLTSCLGNLVVPGVTIASQSSTYNDFEASRSVDGQPSKLRMNEGSCSHTGGDSPAWLRIRLDKVYNVKEVKFWYRNDGELVYTTV